MPDLDATSDIVSPAVSNIVTLLFCHPTGALSVVIGAFLSMVMVILFVALFPTLSMDI
jgi:hypothetical protein